MRIVSAALAMRMLATTSVLGLALASSNALAQAADAAASQPQQEVGLETIVVTARKREENVQSTPLSVSAFSEKALAERGIMKASDITSYVPNVQFDSSASESGGGASSQIAIRGIGQVDYVLTVEPGVGVYLDGVYVGKSVGSLIEGADLARVEVLRGPQGTLFGRNTIGGAVQLVSKRPSKNPEFFAEVTGGSFDRRDARVGLSMPINEGLRVRASGAYFSRDGHVKRLDLSGKDTGLRDGNQDRLTGRLVAEIDVTPNLMATVALDGTRIRERSAGGVVLDTIVVPGGNFPGVFNAGLPSCGPAPGTIAPYCYGSFYVQPLGSRQTYSTFDSRSNVDVWGASMTLDWDLGGASLKSISAYRNVQADIAHDFTGSPYYMNAIRQTISTRQYSQEFQLSGKAFAEKLNYVLGVFYLREEGRQVFPVINSLIQFNSGGDIKNDSFAVFGQTTYEITDKLSVTGGLRYTHESRIFNPGLQTIVSYDNNPGTPVAGWLNILSTFKPAPLYAPVGSSIFPAGDYKRTSSAVTPMVSLNYKLQPDVMAYASYSQGFKGGGFVMRYFPPIQNLVTPAQLANPDALIGYADPERATTYEVGIKSEFLDRKVRLNIAGFYTDYKDIQVTYNVNPGGLPVPLVPTLANAGRAHIKGFEVETSIAPVHWLRIDGSLGYLDAKYVSIDPQVLAQDPAALSHMLPNTSKWTVNIGSTVTFMDGPSGKLFARGDYSYRTKQAKEFSNWAALIQPAYGVMNASVTYQAADKHWELSAGGTNLTDTAYLASGVVNPALGAAQGVPSRPREWYVKLRYQF